MKKLWWGKYAKYYDSIWDSAWTAWYSNYIIGILENEKVKSALDLGCGTGLFAQYMVARGLNVTGVDICFEMLEIARKRCPDTLFINKEVSNLDLKVLTGIGAVIALNLVHVCMDINNVADRIISKIAGDSILGIITWPADQMSLWKMFWLDRKYGSPLFPNK